MIKEFDFHEKKNKIENPFSMRMNEMEAINLHSQLAVITQTK